VVQEYFLAVGISNHSSLSGAYSKFLIKNSQFSEVADMKMKLDVSYFSEDYDDSEQSPHRRSFTLLRKAMCRWYKHNLNKSFLCYLRLVQIGTTH